MKTIIYTFLLFFMVHNSAYADQISISFAESPTSNSISIKAEFQFDKSAIIYYSQARKSMYPIIGMGLIVTCIKMDDEKLIKLRPKQNIQAKVPQKTDKMRVKQYREVFNLEPKNMQHQFTALKPGNYLLTITYDTRELNMYPESEDLTEKFIRSNELKFKIK